MPGPATVSDVTARSLRPLSSIEQTVTDTLLDDAWQIIINHRPLVAQRVDDDAAFRALIIQIQCAMVLRVLRNPDGVLEETVDDYRYRLDQAVSSGALYISDGELAQIGLGDGGSSGAWTIRTRPYVDRQETWFL